MYFTEIENFPNWDFTKNWDFQFVDQPGFIKMSFLDKNSYLYTVCYVLEWISKLHMAYLAPFKYHLSKMYFW